MSTFLKLLPLELSGIDESDLIEPGFKPEKNDNVVGEMPDMCRRLFTLGLGLEKTARQYLLDAQYCTDKAVKSQLLAKANESAKKAQVLMLLMWIGIRDELELWGENIGMREGFKVVTRPDMDDDVPPFFKGLFNLE